jgi:hypothetical protein
MLLNRLLSLSSRAVVTISVALVASGCVGAIDSDPSGASGGASSSPGASTPGGNAMGGGSSTGGSPPGGIGSPGIGGPGTTNPGIGSPGIGGPGTTNPGIGNPGIGSPGTGNPGTGNPGTGVPPLPPSFVCNAPMSFGYRTLRLLTREQYQNSVNDILAVDFDVTKLLPPDASSGSFVNNNDLSVLEGSYASYVQIAEKIAAWSAQRNFAPALNCGTMDPTCATRFVDELIPRIIRRPLAADEKQGYLDVARGTATGGDVKKGIEAALAAVLSSPQFVYRHELGEKSATMGADVFALTPYEIATFLSYTFTGSTPDRELLDAARNRTLETPEQIERQAARLMNGPRSVALFKDLVHRWLGTGNLEIYTKDPLLFPTFAEVVPHMKAELSETFSHVMLQAGETFKSLFDPTYTFANAALARHYGITGVGGDQLQKVPTTTRGGLLLSGAFLSKWAHPDEPNPITRAVHLRRDFLCQDIPDPPPNINISRDGKAGEIEAFLREPTTTNRMAMQRLTEDAGCAVCHSQVINPLGFGLEDYDTVANVRATDRKGNAIDANGALWSPTPELQLQQDANRADARVEFKGGKGLARLLAEDGRVSSLAKACVAKQVMSFAVGVDARAIGVTHRRNVVALNSDEKESYHCDVGRMVEVLSTSSPRKMLEKLATLSSVRFRKAFVR